jgi:hypothetical protein
MRLSHLLWLSAFDALLAVNSFEAFNQLRAEATRQFTSFDPPHLIAFSRFAFEFVRDPSRRAGLLAEELEEAR